MEIKKIQKLKDFGIYKDFSWHAGLDSFKKFNLFYGWNGSGKSTLSGLFYQLHKKDNSALIDFGDFSFKIEAESGEINNTNYQSHTLNIHVFNNIFIEDNLNWDKHIKNILLVSEDGAKDVELLKSKEKDFGSNKKTILDKNTSIEKNKRELDGFYSSKAKTIKEIFRGIDGSDKKFSNYDKSDFQKFIESNKVGIANPDSILSEEKIEELVQAIKPNILPIIELKQTDIKNDKINSIRERLLALLNENITTKPLQRLADNVDIGLWVENGIELHKKHSSKTCEFCGAELSDERMRSVEQHFSEEFKKFKERIANAQGWLPTQKIKIDEYAGLNVYSELKASLVEQIELLNKASVGINYVFDEWMKLLTKKHDNPFEKFDNIPFVDASLIDEFVDIEKKILEIVGRHNKKSNNFKEETDKLKSKLELHYTAQFLKEFEFDKKKAELENEEEQLKATAKANQELNLEIEALKLKVSSAKLGEKEFNSNLHKFMGRNDISLRYSEEKNGYEIIRGRRRATKLSEGGKTAIAFVYFVAKLKEDGNKIENSIVVVDDPISSFDSNHLFSAYSFLKTECENAKQLFVLTHNFNYFKLVRDWFYKKPETGKEPRFAFYSIESEHKDDSRVSVIKKADKALCDYGSEYHYIFSKVHEFNGTNSLSLENAYLVANLSRKLLEAFLSFKFPKKRNFADLVEMSPCEKSKKEKIYRFINKYSHNLIVSAFDGSDDNILSESQTVVNDIFEEIIKKLDPKHYSEMVEVVSGH